MDDEQQANLSVWSWLLAAPPEFIIGCIFGAGIVALGQRATSLKQLKAAAKRKAIHGSN